MGMPYLLPLVEYEPTSSIGFTRMTVSMCFFSFFAVAAMCFWRGSAKPLLAIGESLNGEEAFDKMDFDGAEKSLKRAIARDSLPAEVYSNLAKVKTVQFMKDPMRKDALQEAILFQKEALSRDPGSRNYQRGLLELLALSGTPKKTHR